MRFLTNLHIVQNPICQVCKLEDETIPNIFLHCYIARKFFINLGLNTQQLIFSNSHWLTILKDQNFPLPPTAPIAYNWMDFMPFALWNLWLNRNDNVYNLKSTIRSPAKALNYMMEYLLLTGKERTTANKIPIRIKWHPPLTGYFKLNIDGADDKRSKSGMGGLI